MIAGILGLVLSLTGIISVWVIKPYIYQGADSLITTLDGSIDTSIKVMAVTEDALGATVNSIDALSTMLEATAASVESTQPLLQSINDFMGVKLPDTISSATDSLRTAQQGAEILDSAIRSFDTFKAVLSGVPLIGSFVEAPTETYNPEKSLADSLGDVATNLSDLPGTFGEMATTLDKADDNLTTIQDSLDTMATNVSQISTSIAEYQMMMAQSQKSMENIRDLLNNIQKNLNQILIGAALILSLFLLWLLAAQVVILTQGWELLQGTADRMEMKNPSEPVSESATE